MLLDWLRRHQEIVVPLALFLFPVFLLAYGSYTEHRDVSLFSRAVLSTVGFFQGTVTSSVNRSSSIFDRYLWLRGVEEENRRLRQELDELRRKNYMLQEQEIENQRLRKLLRFRPHEDIASWIPAEVIGDNLFGLNKTVTIDKGSVDGIKPRMAVIAYDGALVGQILDEPGSAISFFSSQVLLITDRRSRVAVMSQRSRDKGVLAGTPEGKQCELAPKERARATDIKVGDLLVSTGGGGVFRKGWPVGEVIEVKTDATKLSPRIVVKPIADFSKIEEVMVILPVGERP